MTYSHTVGTRASWAEPIEGIWQQLASGAPDGISAVAHLSLADELFMAAVESIPRPQREWGVITWLSDVFDVSRPTIYALGKRVCERLCAAKSESEQEPEHQVENTEEVSKTRLIRTAMTSA